MKGIKAVIFDMDGVLVDSEAHHVRIERQLFDRFELAISPEEHVNYMGTAMDVMWATIIRNKGLKLSLDKIVEATYAESRDYFSQLKEIPPFPGLLSVLVKLQEKQVPVAVASSSSAAVIEVIMEKSGLKRYFKQVVSSELVGKSKPAPDVFLHAASLLRVDPDACLVIEDSTNGIKAAKAANMSCIAYRSESSNGQDQSLADLQIDDYCRLAAMVEDMVG
ncbi:HAD family hydrolase [Sunxiuqinia sp. sy24]|uniref:HAD family hydrolase n=1 Tax=Sunxiuqinia sp. sy24 TaxID=3461495 RepID=UPI004045EEF6